MHSERPTRLPRYAHLCNVPHAPHAVINVPHAPRAVINVPYAPRTVINVPCAPCTVILPSDVPLRE